MKIYQIFFTLLFICTTLYGKTIAIFGYEDARVKPWDPDAITRGLPGSEEAIIYMSQRLAALGYHVTVFANPDENSPYSLPTANPRFVKASKDDGQTKFDIAISWRAPWKGRELRKRAEKVYLWLHDPVGVSYSRDDTDAFDEVLWLSNWQRENWMGLNPQMGRFTKIFGNGVNLNQFQPTIENKNPYSCIYGSNYAQGLEILLDGWPEVKKQFPKATLDIYYGWTHWGLLSPEKEQKMRKQIEDLAWLDVHEHGCVGHEELNRAYEKASLWTYPCTNPESFCITALRAQTAGAIPVVIERGALKETVRFGFKCQENSQYIPTLLQAMKSIENVTTKERNAMRDFVEKEFTWNVVAMKWKTLFDQVVLHCGD